MLHALNLGQFLLRGGLLANLRFPMRLGGRNSFEFVQHSLGLGLRIHRIARSGFSRTNSRARLFGKHLAVARGLGIAGGYAGSSNGGTASLRKCFRGCFLPGRGLALALFMLRNATVHLRFPRRRGVDLLRGRFQILSTPSWAAKASRHSACARKIRCSRRTSIGALERKRVWRQTKVSFRIVNSANGEFNPDFPWCRRRPWSFPVREAPLCYSEPCNES